MSGEARRTSVRFTFCRQAIAETGESIRRAVAGITRLHASANGQRTQVVTMQDGATRVVVR